MEPLLWPTRLLGAPDKPPLLMLHGFMGSGADWLPVAETLADSHYCMLPDLPGHGANTSNDFDHEQSLARMAQGLAFLLTQLGGRLAAVLGYSLGGRVALQLALDHPERVSHLVLENASPGINEPDERAARLALDAQRAAAIREDLPAFLDRWYGAPLFANLASDSERLAAVKGKRAANDARWLAKLIVELSPGRVPSNWPRLGTLQMPVTLIGGALDATYQAIQERMTAAVPQATRHTLPDAGHNTHAEQADAFTALLSQILN